MDKYKLVSYLREFVLQDDVHQEVTRFIKDLVIKVEFGHFEEDETEECDNEEFDNM